MKPNYVLKPVMKKLGITELRVHQLKPVQSLMKGHDTIVIAGTSTGKSVIYQLPALLQEGKLTLVVEPTLALIYNQVETLKGCGIEAEYIDHSRTKKDVTAILSKAVKGKLSFLYVTPERLQSKKFQTEIASVVIHMVVIDECHCITEWGYTFRESYLEIGAFLDSLPKRPLVCACSATLPEDRLVQVSGLLHMKAPNIYRSDLKRKNLVLLKKDVTCKKKSLEKRLKERFKALEKCLEKYHTDKSVIIYTLTTGYTDAVYNCLNEKYPGQVARYHAQIKPESLKHKMELEFLQGKRKIMVATTAFGMGIDVPDVELVVHFNTPISMVDYIQQIGRGGRDQMICAHCVLFYDRDGDDGRIVKSFLKKAGQTSKQARKFLEQNYAEVQSFLESDRCMVQDILQYQGQEEKISCKCCTNCAKNRRSGRK